MPPKRTSLKIPGMCALGPPSYSELETNDRRRLRREAALARVSQDATYCVHYSSLRRILNSQDLADRIARYPEGDRTRIAATAGHLDEKTKHQLIMAQLRGMPVEILDRTYQTFYEIGIAPPTHEEMTDIIIAKP